MSHLTPYTDIIGSIYLSSTSFRSHPTLYAAPAQGAPLLLNSSGVSTTVARDGQFQQAEIGPHQTAVEISKSDTNHTGMGVSKHIFE